MPGLTREDRHGTGCITGDTVPVAAWRVETQSNWRQIMNSRRTLITRIGMMLVLALALFAAPSALRAQPTPCICDHYTLIVDSTVGCNVTICEKPSPVAPPCTTLAPGSRLRIPCPIDEVAIKLCDGTNYVLIGNPVIGICTPVLQIGPACCVRVCRGTDPVGCPTLTVSPAPCAVVNCP
jgi:hypothetical protein